jgi:tetratricopeptide (TPR) repeat protein
LAAQDVFDALIRELQLEAPELVRDPLGFVASQLKQAILSAEEPAGSSVSDPYSLRSVVERIELARRQQIKETQENEVSLESIRDALRRSSYLEAARKAKKIDLVALDENHSKDFVELLTLALQNLQNNPAEAKKASQICVEICRPVPEDLRSKIWAKLWVTALYEYARALDKLGSAPEAISAYEQVAKAHTHYPASNRLWRAVWALKLKGDVQKGLGEQQKAIESYDEAVKEARDSRHPVVQRGVVRALCDKAAALRELHKNKEALGTLDDVISQFGDSENEIIRANVSWAFVTKADLQEEAGELEQASLIRDAVIAKFAGSDSPGTETWVAWATYDKVRSLRQLKMYEQALQHADQAIARFGKTSNQRALHPVVAVLRAKASLLQDLGNQDGALETQRGIAAQFANSSGFEYDVAASFEAQGDLLAGSRPVEALAAYDEVTKRFRESADEDVRSVVQRVSSKIANLKSLQPEPPKLTPRDPQ